MVLHMRRPRQLGISRKLASNESRSAPTERATAATDEEKGRTLVEEGADINERVWTTEEETRKEARHAKESNWKEWGCRDVNW